MANIKHVEILKRGVKAWNAWRRGHPEIKPDLSGADLREINLYFDADLRNVDLSGADLRNANLECAKLMGAVLKNTNLSGASLRKIMFESADLRGANLSYTDLHRAHLTEADMRDVDLTGSHLDIHTARKTKLHGAILRDIPEEGFYPFEYTSFLELATAEGLDELHPLSQPFILKYITEAFEFAHRKDTEEAAEMPGFVEYVIKKIKVLKRLYSKERFTSEFVEVVQLINVKLVEFLKRNPEELYKLSWRAFEELIAEFLSSFGWEVKLTQPSKDHGYDIFGVYRDVSGIPHAWIIECKKWAKDRLVGVDIVKTLYGTMNDLRVGAAMLATTSHFTKGAKEFKASRYDFELRDYEAIIEWLNAYHPNPEGKLVIKDCKLVLPGVG